jgi:myo-inositol-hexaphosphate 3-phosphohydrolase
MIRKDISILNDDREIQSVFYPGEEIEGFSVIGPFSQGGTITKIVAYSETGENAYVPWIAVYKGDSIFVRIPASQVTIAYLVNP